jgi:hypothetical protein
LLKLSLLFYLLDRGKLLFIKGTDDHFTTIIEKI